MEIVFNKLISLRLSILVLFILNILGVSLSNAEIYTFLSVITEISGQTPTLPGNPKTPKPLFTFKY